MYILVEQMKRSYLTSYSMISLILILLLTNTDRGVLSSSITLPKRVVVIGGGAAGYFAAIECARVLSESSVRQLVEVLIDTITWNVYIIVFVDFFLVATNILYDVV